MHVTLDGQAVFDEQELTIAIGSPGRASLERSIAGLDGVLSIDLGRDRAGFGKPVCFVRAVGSP